MTITARWLIILFSFIGIADSVYLTEHALVGTPPTCNLGGVDGCRVVAESAYSSLFGIPLGAYGVVFYALFFVLAAVSLVWMGNHLRDALKILGVIGAIASVIFIAIQVFLIGALCLYCVLSAILTFLLLGAVFWKPPLQASHPS